MSKLTIVDHPLAQHKLSLMRDVNTSTQQFRQLLRETSFLLGYEALRDLPLERRRITTPLREMDAPVLGGKKLVLVSILRAGNGLLEGLLELVPSARVGHVGLHRNPDTLEAVEYYFKLPGALAQRRVVVVDPMLATANSAIAAVRRLKRAGATDLRMVSLVAAPEGIAAFGAAHPDVPIFTVAVDERLDEHGYIVPGLGDAGDRIYGTK